MARGEISAIVKSKNDYYIGFKNKGLVKLIYLPDQKNKYKIENIAIQSGIFSLAKDKYQDIIWIGSDGQGIVKVSLNTSGGNLTIKGTKRIVINGGRMISNYFFTSFQENDSIVW